MLEHNYTKEEIQEIRTNFHKTVEFRKQFGSFEVDEEKVIQDFLSGNFKIGSVLDPLLDCIGETINKYKFKQHTPKRINTMNTISNLPHIMDAEVVKSDKATSNETTLKGSVSSITFSAKPSSKKPGKAIINVSIAYGEEEIAFKYSTKIENAGDTMLATNFQALLNVVDTMLQFNVSLEETEESGKGVYNAKFEPREVETYGQYFEIEAVEAEINFTKTDTVMAFVQDVFKTTEAYHTMLDNLVVGKSRVVTIVKGGKNNVEYISNESPEICGNLIKLTGNTVTEDTYVSSLDIKSISEHIITDEDFDEMASVIFSDLEPEEVATSEDSDDEVTELVEAPEEVEVETEEPEGL